MAIEDIDDAKLVSYGYIFLKYCVCVRITATRTYFALEEFVRFWKSLSDLQVNYLRLLAI